MALSGTARFTSSLAVNYIRLNVPPLISPIKAFHTIPCQHHYENLFCLPSTYQRKRRRIDKTFPPNPSTRPFTASTPRLDPSSSESSRTPPIPWPTHPNPTPYEIFGLPRTATPKEIKSRYFQLVKLYHPDHAPHSQIDRFRKVVDAYKVLSHPSKRLEWDRQHPRETHAHTSQASEFRQPWSGSRLSRRRTETKGPPPSGGWSFRSASGSRFKINHDYSGTSRDADNEHFNYERHFARNWEQEMKIKRRMDELHAHRVEFERRRAQHSSTMRIGFAFTLSLFLLLVMAAKSIAPD